MKKPLLIAVLAIFSFQQTVKAQCTVVAKTQNDAIRAGYPTVLTAIPTNPTALTEDFNSSTPAGWTFSKTQVSSNSSSCTTLPAGDASPSTWPITGSVGAATKAAPREIITPKVNVKCGGIVKFDFFYPATSSPCYGPMYYWQAVKLQYSTVSGWQNMFIFDPNLDVSFGLSKPSYLGWHSYSFHIPDEALTDTTRFRWVQGSTVASGNSNWSIDNVHITGSCATPYTYAWSPSAGLTDSTVANPIASPTVTTTYTITYSDGQGSSCSNTITVNVVPANAAIIKSCAGPSNPTVLDLSARSGEKITFVTNPADSVALCDLVTATSKINVNGLPYSTLTTTSIDKVCMTVKHTRDRDLDIKLTSPGGSIIELSTGNPTVNFITPGGKLTADNGYINTCFSASGLKSIIATAADTALVKPPFTGTYRPEQDFTNLNGTVNGNWILSVYDKNTSESSGSIKNWSITFNTPNTSLSWSPADSIISGANTYAPTVKVAATTDFILTVNSAFGNTYTDTVPVFVSTLPTVIATATEDTVCLGKATTLSASGAKTYAWTGGVTNDTLFNPKATATYTVTGTDSLGCKNTDTITVVVTQGPPVSISAKSSICRGDTTHLVATSGFTTYVWSTSPTTNNDSLSVYPNSTTTYSLTTTDANGCNSTATHALTVNNVPNVIVTGIDSICAGDSTLYTASGAGVTGAYVWVGGPTANTYNVKPTTTTTYTVTGTTTAGCSKTATKTLNVKDCNTVGIQENEFANAVMFPNPIQNTLTIDFKHTVSAVQISVYDVIGNRIVNQKIQNQSNVRIDFEKLAEGVYFVEMLDNQTKNTYKVIKE